MAWPMITRFSIKACRAAQAEAKAGALRTMALVMPWMRVEVEGTGTSGSISRSICLPSRMRPCDSATAPICTMRALAVSSPVVSVSSAAASSAISGVAPVAGFIGASRSLNRTARGPPQQPAAYRRNGGHKILEIGKRKTRPEGTGRVSCRCPAGDGTGQGSLASVGKIPRFNDRSHKSRNCDLPYCALATGATSGVMRRIATRRFSRWGPSAFTLRYCSP